MGVEQLFTGSRWQLLEALAKKPQSTSELAEKLQTSQANTSQQLKQLELAGIIKRRRAPEKKRVHYVYEIPQEYTYLISLAPGRAQKSVVEHKDHRQLILTLLSHEHAIPLTTFLLCLPDYFNKSLAIGVLKRPNPQLFILTEHVDEFRTNSNIEVQTIQGEAKIAIWSHSANEVAQGLKNNDQYFYDSLQQTSIVYDPQGELQKHKTTAEEQQ